MIEREGQLNLMVYGAERLELALTDTELDNRNYHISFHPYDTEKRFCEFDGVITFQGLFERFKQEQGRWGVWTSHHWDRNELDKRDKETELLIKKGGFICFLLHCPFIDRVHRTSTNDIDARNSDLAKRYLNWTKIYRSDLRQRSTSLRSVRSEFTRFFEYFGAVWSEFSNQSDLAWRNLALRGRKPVGMVIADYLFFVPCLLPERDKLEEFYRLLTDALTVCFKKLRSELPTWADSVRLPDEGTLLEEQTQLRRRLEEVERCTDTLRRFKRVLVGDGDSLVDDVVFLLREGLGFSVDDSDEYHEDIKILDESGAPIVFGEIKGTSRGVKYAFINQAHSHRERSNLPPTFPTILVINTHTKNARSVEEKDQEIASEQIQHAVRMNILILRTLDILHLLILRQKGVMSSTGILEVWKGECGWHHASQDNAVIVKK